MTRSRCAALVWHGLRTSRCANSGKIVFDGDFYCGLHDPATVAKRRAERGVRLAAKINARERSRDPQGLVAVKGAAFDDLLTLARTLATTDEAKAQVEAIAQRTVKP